jgi:hypothetical protein
MIFYKRPLLLLLLLSLVSFVGLIELIHPSPKLNAYCQQSPCSFDAVDKLTVYSADYRGGLVLWLGGLFVLALACVVFSLIPRKENPVLLFGVLLMFDVIIYAIINRFFSVFSQWPVQSWLMIVSVFTICTLLFLFPIFVKRQKYRHKL